jgi:hypothetical protein
MTELSNLDQKMLQIKSLDSSASIVFSQFTLKWHVSANIEVGGDGVLSGITEHESSPELAVGAYFKRLTTVDLDHYLVTSGYAERDRRHWRWNGAAFQEVPR